MKARHNTTAPETPEESLQASIATLQTINAAILQLDASIRPRAFELLCARHLPEQTGGTKRDAIPLSAASMRQLLDFVGRYRSGTPAENVCILMAWNGQRHSRTPLSLQQLRELATLTDTSLPRRPDNTMRYGTHAGHALFEREDGLWRLSAYGLSHFQEKYPVTG